MEEFLRNTLANLRETKGPDNKETISCMSLLGTLLKNEGKLAEAEELFREALAAGERTLGAEHPMTLGYKKDLTEILNSQGRRNKATKKSRKTCRRRRKSRRNTH